MLVRSVRRLRQEVALSAVVFSAGLAAGALVAGAPSGESGGSSLDVSLTFGSLLLNNLTVYSLVVLGGLTFGATSVFLVFNTGLLLGTVAFAGLSDGSSPVDVVLLVAPHGVLEISAFLLGAAVGLRVTRQLVGYLRNERERVLRAGELRRYAVVTGFGLVLIVVAAFIEASVTRPLYELLR